MRGRYTPGTDGSFLSVDPMRGVRSPIRIQPRCDFIETTSTSWWPRGCRWYVLSHKGAAGGPAKLYWSNNCAPGIRHTPSTAHRIPGERFRGKLRRLRNIPPIRSPSPTRCGGPRDLRMRAGRAAPAAELHARNLRRGNFGHGSGHFTARLAPRDRSGPVRPQRATRAHCPKQVA